ncbi:MAG: exo-alpha-sialidase [Nitrosopumilus sp.]|nr:exo-alpha-sialidase [Nitrosopumilus sp.]
MNKIIIPAIIVIIAIISATFAFTNDMNNTKQVSVSEIDTSSILPMAMPFVNPIQIAQTSIDSQPAPNIAIDDSGKMFIIYPSTENRITNLYLKTSVDNGKTFSDSVRINSIDGNVVLDGRVAPTITFGNDGQVYALWANSTPEPNLFMGVYRTLIFAQSLDGGKSFLPSIEIAANELPSGKFFQNMAVSGDGNIHVAWLDSPAKNNGTGYLESDKSRPSTLKYSYSADGGKSFLPTKSLAENPCPCCNVQLAADAENNVYVSWRQVFGDGETQVRDMVVASSYDSGKTFSDPVKISDDNFNFHGCVHVGAPMDVDSKGNLHVVWYTGKEGAPGIYYATSSDKGQTFSQPIPILTSEWVPPLRVYLTIDDNDIAWITWEDATGHSTNDTIWRYGETKAMIYAAKITSDGTITKFDKPVTIEEGKSPAIASGNNLVSIVWTGDDNSVQFTTMP